MVDITPELYDAIKKTFDEFRASDSIIRGIESKISNGVATHVDTQKYAERVADHLSKSLRINIKPEILPDGRLYFNIANRTIKPAMIDADRLIGDVCEEIQEQIYKNIGIGIKPAKSIIDESRIDDLINKISGNEGQELDDVSYILDEPVKNCVRSHADDYMRSSAQRDYGLGLKPKVSRRTSYKCCEWCEDLTGSYIYPDVPNEVFQRHDNCRCSVVYDGVKLSAYQGQKGKANTFRA